MFTSMKLALSLEHKIVDLGIPYYFSIFLVDVCELRATVPTTDPHEATSLAVLGTVTLNSQTIKYLGFLLNVLPNLLRYVDIRYV